MNELTPRRIQRLAAGQDIEAEYAHDSQPEEFKLTDYWNIFVKRRRMIMAVFLAVFAVGVYFVFSATKLYTATATMKIEPQNPQVTGVGALQPVQGVATPYDFYQTQLVLLKSRPLAGRVITDLNLASNKVFRSSAIVSPNPLDHFKSWIYRALAFFSHYVGPLFEPAPEEVHESEAKQVASSAVKRESGVAVSPYLMGRYNAFLEVALVPKTSLVKVAFTTPSPILSEALANAHVQNFMRMSLESRFSLTKEAREFLEQKKAELRQRMEKSDVDLNKFRRTHGVLSVDKGENIIVDRLVDLNRQLTTARSQRIEAESLYRTVQNKNSQDLAEVMKQGLVQQLKSNVAGLEAERARLSTVFKPDHPRIKELGQQIASARQALNNEIENVVRGIKSSYAAALAKERGLQAETDKQQQDALSLKELGVNYTILLEEVNANRSLYENVLKRLSETNVSNDIAISNMQVVEHAERPRNPSSPNIPGYLLAIIFSGLFLGGGIAFAQDYLSSTVGTPEDVWRSVGLGTLGVVPDLNSLGRQRYIGQLVDRVHGGVRESRMLSLPLLTNEPSLDHSPVSVVTESYRTIRTALLLSQAEKPPQIILVTSPSPSEGKTVTSLNLGIALAQDGYSVLVIDGDMRRGCCHSRLGLRNNRGLSNVLTGGLSLDEGIQRTSVHGLSLLSRGVLPPNPSELLGSRKMKELLQELRQSFNFILIDSPPVITISDASILSAVTDGVLLVFNGTTTSTAYAQKAVERLDMVRARMLGVILNGVDLDDPQYSYYQAYTSYYQKLPDADERVINERNGDSAAAFRGFGAPSKTAQTATKPDAEVNPSTGKAGRIGTSREKEREATMNGVADTVRSNAFNRNFAKKNGGGGLAPREFMERITEALIEAMGPVAPLVIRDNVHLLGESLDAFPVSRIDELLNLVQREIFNKDLRSSFRKRIAKELPNLGNG